MKRAWKLSCYFSKTATEENAVLITWRLSWHWEPTVSTELRYICKWSARVDLNHWLFRSKRSTLTRLRYWLIVCCATRFEPCISNLLIGVLKLFRRSTNHNDLQAAFASCKSADGLMCYFTSPSRRTFYVVCFCSTMRRCHFLTASLHSQWLAIEASTHHQTNFQRSVDLSINIGYYIKDVVIW